MAKNHKLELLPPKIDYFVLVKEIREAYIAQPTQKHEKPNFTFNRNFMLL